MKSIYINSERFSTYTEFLSHMQELLMPYSEDSLTGLDALEDVLEGGFGVFDYESSILIKWENFRKSAKDFGYEATIQYYKDALETCHPSNRSAIKQKIAWAEEEEGFTLFHMILDVFIESRASIELF